MLIKKARKRKKNYVAGFELASESYLKYQNGVSRMWKCGNKCICRLCRGTCCTVTMYDEEFSKQQTKTL